MACVLGVEKAIGLDLSFLEELIHTSKGAKSVITAAFRNHIRVVEPQTMLRSKFPKLKEAELSCCCPVLPRYNHSDQLPRGDDSLESPNFACHARGRSRHDKSIFTPYDQVHIDAHKYETTLVLESYHSMEENLSAPLSGDAGGQVPDIATELSVKRDAAKSRVPQSCAKVFDSLYFCYSPVYQGRQYYMFGNFDNCRGRLRRFRLCLLSRVKSSEDAELMFKEEEHREKEAGIQKDTEPIWEMREEFLNNVARAEEQDTSDTGHEKDSWWL